jgi:hypothetical protein
MQGIAGRLQRRQGFAGQEVGAAVTGAGGGGRGQQAGHANEGWAGVGAVTGPSLRSTGEAAASQGRFTGSLFFDKEGGAGGASSPGSGCRSEAGR